MKCSVCGKELPEGVVYCQYCGSPVGNDNKGNESRICPMCGGKIKAGAKFCLTCGAPVQEQEEDTTEKKEKNGGNPPPPPVTGPDKDGMGAGKRSVLVIVAAVLLIVALILVLVVVLGGSSGTGSDKDESVALVLETEMEEEEEEEAEEEGEGEEEEEKEEEEEAAASVSDTIIRVEEEEKQLELASLNEEETQQEESMSSELEEAQALILEKYSQVLEAISFGEYETYTDTAGSTAYLEGEEILAVYVKNGVGTDYVQYYYYEDGELYFAIYENEDEVHNFYFSESNLFLWSTTLTQADEEDLEEWENLVLDLSETVYAGMYAAFWEWREEESQEQETEAPEYILEGSDSRYIETSELTGLSKNELRLARNEIYARHGRKFNDESLTEYFSQFDWYEPSIEPEDFTQEMLNKYEVANLETIVAYEEEMGYR